MSDFEEFHEHFTTHLTRYGIALKKMEAVQNSSLDNLHQSIKQLPKEQAEQMTDLVLRWISISMESAEALDSIKDDLLAMLTDYKKQIIEIKELNEKVSELASRLLEAEKTNDSSKGS